MTIYCLNYLRAIPKLHELKPGEETVNGYAFNYSVWETNAHDRAQTYPVMDKYMTEGGGLDVVVLQLGENVSDASADGSTYESDYAELIQHIKEEAPNAQIVTVGDFWADDTKDAVKKSAADETGVTYVDLAEIHKVGYTPKYDMQSFKPPMAAPRVISYDVEEPTPMSKDFGAYAAIILDMGEFLKRVKSATTDKGWDVVSGPVNYHPLRLGNKKIVRVNGDRTMTIMMEPAIELDSLIKNGGAVINERDAFDKWDVHDNEREYRICIKRDGKFKDDVRLEIGDISDIAIAVKANEVRQAIDDLLVNRKIQPSIDGYVGTTSREKMRHEFYDMGDGMVNIMLVLGGITEYVKE